MLKRAERWIREAAPESISSLVACTAWVRESMRERGTAASASKSALNASIRSWRDIGLILAGDGTGRPSISRTVAALEARLGAKVFLRTNPRVTLTDAGSVLLERGRAILSEIYEAQDAAQGTDSLPIRRPVMAWDFDRLARTTRRSSIRPLDLTGSQFVELAQIEAGWRSSTVGALAGRPKASCTPLTRP